MKTAVMSLAFGMLLLQSGAAMSQCQSITDRDTRAYCQGTTQGNSSACNSISDRDRRNQCVAIADRNESRCNSISDSQQRALCTAQAR